MPSRFSLPRWFAFLVLALGLGATAGCGGVGVGDLVDEIQDGMDDGDGGLPPPPPPAGTMTEDEEAMALECFDRMNAERRDAGVDELQWLDPATDAAFLHSLDMDVRDFFDHVNPDGDGPGTRLHAQGIPWSACAENIARGYVDAEAVIAGWMASEGHRENMLSPLYTHVGVGVREGAGGPFWTQNFVR
jgi:uncharacterized protein YkwD